MSRLLVICFVIGLACPALASETADLPTNLAPTTSNPKPAGPSGPDAGGGDGREGGETIETAFVIPGLPFTDTGNTCDNINDYDEACPYLGSISRDVVYVFTPEVDLEVDIDLCLSSYDTKVYVYEDHWTPGVPLACNDDYHFDEPCWDYSSFLSEVPMTAGTPYYIVIDGYGGQCGDYLVEIIEHVSCELPPCPDNALPEGEPPLEDYYVDNYNGGCGSQPPAFQPITWIDDETGCGRLCGVSGWYYFDADYRDTDWFEVTASGTEITWTIEAEYPVYFFVIYPDCNTMELLYTGEAQNPCEPASLSFPTNPGSVFWLWVGPTAFTGPAQPFEFDYFMEVCGIQYDIIPTEPASWGGVKALYR